MTIKRRLFISNILMLVIPAVLSFLTACLMILSLAKHYGIELGSGNRENIRINQDEFTGFGLIMVLSGVTIVLVTNRLLTQKVFRSIAVPLDELVYGVRQIRDGNLEYRINYLGKDEFSGVCSDFNDMAGRLLDMVNARRRDEENRRELIAGISHDLRTPLTSIKSYVEGIELGVASTPQMREKYYETIKSKTRDMEHIINQLFLFTKLDVGEFPMRMERAEAGRWLSDYVSSVSEEYSQKGLKINLSDNGGEAEFCVDSVQFGNVLGNIIENSLKYGRDNQAVMNIHCRREGADVVITLTDNGPGVPEDELALLFDVFYRADKARSNPSQGSGLGLAISVKIIERLNGTICASNAPEGGLAVTITLPVL